MHHNFYLGARIATRLELRSQGKSLHEINHIMAGFEDGVLDAAVKQAEATMGPMPVGAIGDGSILAAIIAFFKSPLGQAIIKILIALLMGL